MEEEILKKIEDQEKKLDKIYISVEKTRKYFLSIMIMTVVFFVFPLIGLLFALPRIINSYTDMFNF